MSEPRKSTSTSSFGVSKREAHDASEFYARFTPPTISEDETVVRQPVLDEIYVLDARHMDDDRERIKPNSVALVVTSPPYFAGKEYEVALGEGHIPADYVAYLAMLHDVFAKCVEKLEPGGRIAVNVANLGRKPYRSLSADVITILQDRLGLLLRGEIIWQKGKGATGSTTWGSFQSPANPVLRDLTERIIVASKGRFDRAVGRRKRPDAGLPSVATMAKDDFMDATTDVWDLAPESATRVGHPAPFPAELPQRLIELYTYEGDVVLDPFMGSGSTAVAAVRTGRHFLGFDTDRHYVVAAKERVASERDLVAGSASPGIRVPAVKPDDDGTSATAVELGEKATTLATRLLTECGFTDVTDKVKGVPHGVDISLQANDAGGRRWLVEVAGAFTTPRTGLRRTDVLWRTLGKASIVAASLGEKAPPLLVLTTDLPATGGGAGALAAVKGKTVVEVLELTDPATPERLAAHATGK